MDRLYKTPSPLHTPIGTPTRWYSPLHTPANTPVGSLQHAALHRQSTESLHSTVSDRLAAHAAHSAPHAHGPVCGEEADHDGDQPSETPSTGLHLPSIEESDDQPESNTKHKEGTPGSGKFPYSASEILTLATLCFTTMSSSMFGSLLAPFFPTEAVKKGVSQTWIGLIFGSFQLVSFIMSPIWGHYITKIGAKFMFISGILVCGSCAILFGVLQWCPPGAVYIAMCFCTRTLESMAGAAVSTSNMAIATYTFPRHVSTVIGTLNAFSCIGLMAGPPLGGVLFQVGGFYLPFLVTGSTFILAGLFCICLLPAPKDNTEESETVKREKIPKWQLVKVPVIPVAGYLTLIGQFAIGYIDVVFTIHLTQKYPELTPTMIGLIFLISPLVVVALAPLCGVLSDKFPKTTRPIMIVGALISGLGFAGLGPTRFYDFLNLPTDKLWVTILALGIAGVGWAAIVVTYQEFNNAARRRGFPHSLETQGLVSGVYNAFSNLGAFLGPIVGGLMSDYLSFNTTSTIVACLIAYAGVQMFIYTICEKICCDIPPLPSRDEKQEDEKSLIANENNSFNDGAAGDVLPHNEYQPIRNRSSSSVGNKDYHEHTCDKTSENNGRSSQLKGHTNVQYQDTESNA